MGKLQPHLSFKGDGMRVGDMVRFSASGSTISGNLVIVLEMFSSSETRLNYLHRGFPCFRGLKVDGSTIEDLQVGWEVVCEGR